MPSEKDKTEVGQGSSDTPSGRGDGDDLRAISTINSEEGDSNAGHVGSGQDDVPYTITQHGHEVEITMTSGTQRGDRFRIDTLGPRGIAAARARWNNRPAGAPEEPREEDLPANSYHDGSGRQISKEEYERVSALEIAEEERRKAAKKAQKAQKGRR